MAALHHQPVPGAGLDAHATLQPIPSFTGTPSPSPPPPYTLYSHHPPPPPPPPPLPLPLPLPPHPQFVWYPHPPASHYYYSFASMPPSTKELDAFSSPEDPPSGSASPSSQALGVDGVTPGTASPSGTTDARISTPSVPAACLACRGKHLKCDGQTPCSRCLSSSSECVYVASRRGYKGPRRGTSQNPNKRQRSSSPKDSSSTSSGADGPILLAPVSSASMAEAMTTTFTPNIVLSAHGSNSPFMTPVSNGNMQLFRGFCTNNGGDSSQALTMAQATQTQNGVVPAQVPVPTAAERCLDAFYHFFHAAHPFVLPKEYLSQIAKGGGIEPLLAAMRWIGSLYVDAGPARASFFDEARRLCYEPNRPKDGFLVQALVLLVLGLDGSSQLEKAREVLAEAERLAVQVGLNTRAYATLQGRGMPVLEESWRRTWWDLYVIDGMIAGVHRATNFLLFDVPADVGLPCEEYQYLSGTIPPPTYLEDLEDADFSEEDRDFSSFAYLILSARNLGKFMRVPPIFCPNDENLARIEALLTNWRLHLPESKRHALHKDGRLDEMMFQAHMMHHATSILLHQPHSQLDSSPTRSVNGCAPHRSVPSGDVFNAHTKHTIQSANEISRMVTHRVPLLSHTHFFTCVVTLSSIVHLSKWALYFVPADDDDLRQQIRLNIGALHKLAEVWTSADRSCAQVKSVAQEIYRMKKQQQLTPQYWLGLTQDEVMSSMAADDSIINDIESILPGMPSMLT